MIGEAEDDFRSGLAKLTELRAYLAAMNLPNPSRIACPECGVRLRGELVLAEHSYHSHGGPEPAHWLEAEAQSS
jgi:hypothetical protein